MGILKVKVEFVYSAVQSSKEELSVPVFSTNLESRYHRDGQGIIKK